jgi:RIO kinase 1
MNRRLPSHPNLEYYRKQAKVLLREYRNHEESAVFRMGSSVEKLRVGLSDAQRVVACEAGFSNWSLLKSAVLDSSDQDREAVPDESHDSPDTKMKQPKQRYESDSNVQRWLKTGDAGKEEDFASSFLAEHHERDWIISSLRVFHAKGLIRDVVGVVKSGKEATVYRCTGQEDGEYLAAKIYRPRMFRSLQNDAVYRENRMAEKDCRLQKAMDKMSRRGRAFRMESWIRFEFDTHKRFYNAGVAVPEPVDSYGNAIHMEYIGDEQEPAPILHHVELDPLNAEPLFNELILNIELMLTCDRVHADLSAFNVLYWREKAIIIDFAQAVDARSGPEVFKLLSRDVENIAKYFAKNGISAEPEYITLGMWSRYLQNERGISAAYTAERD